MQRSVRGWSQQRRPLPLSVLPQLRRARDLLVALLASGRCPDGHDRLDRAQPRLHTALASSRPPSCSAAAADRADGARAVLARPHPPPSWYTQLFNLANHANALAAWGISSCRRSRTARSATPSGRRRVCQSSSAPTTCCWRAHCGTRPLAPRVGLFVKSLSTDSCSPPSASRSPGLGWNPPLPLTSRRSPIAARSRCSHAAAERAALPRDLRVDSSGNRPHRHGRPRLRPQPRVRGDARASG